MPNNKAHTQYKLKSGTLVPGVTTVLSILGKPAIIEWAYQCGLKGVDYHKVRDTAGDIGTLAHYLILCHLKGETPDTSEYSLADLVKAQNCLQSYHAWIKHNPVKPLMIETPLLSEKYGYGGTLDLYAQLDSQSILIDFKTSKAIYPEYLYQVAAYGQLLAENLGKLPDKVLILRINKESNSDFEIKTIDRMDKYFEVFRHCLRIYTLQKELPWS